MKFGLIVQLQQYLSHLVDRGEKISLTQATNILTQGNIIDWLSSNSDYGNLDLRQMEQNKAEINKLILDEYLGSSSSLSAKGINSNGICAFITLIGDVLYRKYDLEVG